MCSRALIRYESHVFKKKFKGAYLKIPCIQVLPNLSVDFFAMTNLDYKHYQSLITHVTNDPIVSYSISPKIL